MVEKWLLQVNYSISNSAHGSSLRPLRLSLRDFIALFQLTFHLTRVMSDLQRYPLNLSPDHDEVDR